MKRKISWNRIRIAAAVLFMIAAGVAFAGIGGGFAGWLHVQFGPALMKCFAAFSVGTLITVLVIALATFLFGRFYCAVFCPFGILQDFIGWISRRKGKTAPNFVKTRYAVAGVAFGMLIFGWTLPFLLLDPYSNFGRIIGSFTAGGMVPLAVIAVLAVWKKRIYCTTVCPVGTLLGLLAKRGVLRLRLTGKCVKCGLCVKACPSGCIDPQTGTLDNERCVRCLNCVSVCRLRAVKFGLPEKKKTPVDETRRAFLVNGGVLIAGLAAGAVLAKAGMTKLADYAKRFKTLPPGAGDAKRFAAKCSACQLCTANCPAKIIVPAPGGDGPVALDLNRGACQYDCNRCSQVCPTGAIRPLTLKAKQKTKIAEAKFNPQSCIVFQEGEKCGKCAGVCPSGAITLRRTGAPRLDMKHCIGCGACQNVCPANPKAMTVHEIEKQTLLEA
ncbi:MAG: 4Fe-4S binding protein [Lentisphaeria bacterium]|nr:4Fe-4S binding protein [Lentisphaeria bacterium]